MESRKASWWRRLRLGLQLCKGEDKTDIPGEMRLPNLQG